MKYMVMECHPGYAVVLSDDGRFLKVANVRYEVGQTVTNIAEVHLPQSSRQPAKKQSHRWIASLAAMAACLALAFTSIFFTNQMPYASVYMTINPEVRIDVNRRDVVVGVEGVNADGQDLLQGYSYKKKDLDLVMDELVDRAIDMGYLHEGGTVTLTLDADDEWIVSHGDHLSSHLSEHLTAQITVTIDIGQKQPIQTAPAGTIVIPVSPEHYGESDYGNDDGDDGDSGYGDTSEEDGHSNYDMPDDSDDDSDDGQTNYGASDYDDDDRDHVTEKEGRSNYNDTIIADESDDDGQSNYEDADSGYDDDSQSNYEGSDSGYDDGDDDD